MTITQLAQKLYEAYTQDLVNHGADMNQGSWDQLEHNQQHAWEAVAHAALLPRILPKKKP